MQGLLHNGPDDVSSRVDNRDHAYPCRRPVLVEWNLGAPGPHVHEEGAFAVVAAGGNTSHVRGLKTTGPEGIGEDPEDEDSVLHTFLNMLVEAAERSTMATVEGLRSLRRLSGELAGDEAAYMRGEGSVDKEQLLITADHGDDQVTAGQLDDKVLFVVVVHNDYVPAVLRPCILRLQRTSESSLWRGKD